MPLINAPQDARHVAHTGAGNTAARETPGGNLLDHIKNLRTKRFLEIYYISYRNLHFFERPDEADRPSTSTTAARPDEDATFDLNQAANLSSATSINS